MSPHKPASLVFFAALGYLLPVLCRNLLSVVALVSLFDRNKKLDKTLKPRANPTPKLHQVDWIELSFKHVGAAILS